MTQIFFQVLGKPVGKGRPRFWQGHAVTPPATRKAEKAVADSARLALMEAPSWNRISSFLVSIRAIYPIPDSWPKGKKAMAAQGFLCPGKPDLDNVVKLILDALNGLAWEDDRSVRKIVAYKCYESPITAMGQPGIYVTVTDIESEQNDDDSGDLPAKIDGNGS